MAPGCELPALVFGAMAKKPRCLASTETKDKTKAQGIMAREAHMGEEEEEHQCAATCLASAERASRPGQEEGDPRQVAEEAELDHRDEQDCRPERA